MEFAAEVMVAERMEEVQVLALGTKPPEGDPRSPDYFVMISGRATDSDDPLYGLAGLHIETSRNGEAGYNLIERLTLESGRLTIGGRGGFADIRIDVSGPQIDQARLAETIALLNDLNVNRPA